MKSAVTALFASVLSFVPLYQAQAFKAEIHGKLSEAAAVVFNICAPSWGLATIDLERTRQIAMGAIEQDNITAERLRNWHFLRKDVADTRGAHEKGFVRYHFLRVYFRLQTEAAVTAGLAQDYIAGGLAHYHQDVMVPGHVLPNFHAGPIADPIDSWRAETLEGYEGGEAFARQVFGDDLQTLCPEIALGGDDLYTLLTRSAAETRVAAKQYFDAVSGDDGLPVRVSWGCFFGFTQSRPSEYFINYGPAKDEFGEVNIKLSQAEDCRLEDGVMNAEYYQVEPATSKFADGRHRAAIITTARMLRIIHTSD